MLERGSNEWDQAVALPGSSPTAFERAALLALLETMPIDTATASTVWDAWSCPAHLLPQLANALSVDLWDDAWPELKKRSIIAQTPELHDLKTTIEAYRRFLDLVDCRLIDYVAPPKGFIAGATFSDEERRAWLRDLPELRLYVGGEPLPFDNGLTADVNFADVAPILADRGRAMAARKAKYYDPATDTLTLIGPVDRDTIDDGDGTAQLVERIAVPGAYDPAAFHADMAFADMAAAIAADFAQAPVFTWRVEGPARTGPVSILDALPSGYGLVDVDVDRVPFGRPMDDRAFFSEISAANVAYAIDDDAPLGFYDVYKIARIGEKSGTPLIDAGSYADIDYVGWPTHTLHLLVDADGPSDAASAFYAGISSADGGAAIADDLRRSEDAVRAAYAASGPSSDHVTMSTEVTRYLALSDGIPLDGSFHFGKRVHREHA